MKKDTMWIPRYLRNWRDVFKSLKTEVKMPFILKNWTQIFYCENECEVILLLNTFYDVFIEQVYTKNNFYHPQPDDIIFDIGANIGLFAFFCHCKAPQTKVHCFEPAPQTRRYLKKNIAVNNLSNTIQIYPYGIFDKSDKKLLIEASNSGQRSLFRHKNLSLQKSDEIDCISFNEAVTMSKETKIDFLKIDCEGSELEILKGISQDIWQKIDKIALEYHDHIRPECSRKILEILEKQGFSCELEPANISNVNLYNRGIIRATNLYKNG